MDKIRVLPDGVANQIAAGEVVGRPGSVVKELMENAVDAGSSSITVNFKEGGCQLIQVVDNGCGMSETDARLAFERHATSKIKNAEDLYHLSSFGFRGEALPSISSVAEVELRTRTIDREVGSQIIINGGGFVSQSPIQTPQGTQLMVKNLFYNVPARRRFLKEPHIEARHLTTEFQRVALANAHIVFFLYNNDAPVYNLPAGNLRQRIAGVHGKPLANNLLEIHVDTSIVKIEGFTGHPSLAKKSNKEQYFFVNGRYFRSPYLHKSLLKAYEKLIAPDTQPPYFLYLEIDPERIDVNVHPSKTEIKFDDEQAIWQVINAAVRESLGKLGVVPMMDFEMDSSIEIPIFKKGEPYKIPEVGYNPNFNPFQAEKEQARPSANSRNSALNCSENQAFLEIDSSIAQRSELLQRDSTGLYSSAAGTTTWDYSELEESLHDRSIESFIEGDSRGVQSTLEIEGRDGFRGILRLNERYCASTLGEALVVVDLWRAEERMLYDRFLAILGNNAVVSQQLLFPEEIDLAPDEFELLKTLSKELNALGFEYHTLNSSTLQITGTPPNLPIGAIAETLEELLIQARELGTSPQMERQKNLAAVTARRCALASRERRPDASIEPLLEELFNSSNGNYTPSGSPILVWITPNELYKRFKS